MGIAIEDAMKPSFDNMGRVLYLDEKQGVCIRAGQIFECPTTKGETRYILTLGVKDGFLYYSLADKGKKTPMEHFVRAVLSGDIWHVPRAKADIERMSMSAIGLDAIANRRTAEETIQYHGDAAEDRFYGNDNKSDLVPLIG